MGCLFLPWRPLLLPPLKPRQSPATATDLATAALTEELAMFAHTEDMVATLGATGPTEAIMERGKLNPQLLPKLKRTLTMALTAMVDTDCLTEAMDVHTEDTAFLTVADMVATDSPTEATAAATTAKGKLRPILKLTPPSARGALLTGAAMATAMDAPTEATVDLIQSPDLTADPTAAMSLLTAATNLLTAPTTTEKKRHQTNNLNLIYTNWTK